MADVQTGSLLDTSLCRMLSGKWKGPRLHLHNSFSVVFSLLWGLNAGDRHLWGLLITTHLVERRMGKATHTGEIRGMFSYLINLLRLDIEEIFMTRRAKKSQVKKQNPQPSEGWRLLWSGGEKVLSLFCLLRARMKLCPWARAVLPNIQKSIQSPKILQSSPVLTFFLQNCLQDFKQPRLLKSEFWQHIANKQWNDSQSPHLTIAACWFHILCLNS